MECCVWYLKSVHTSIGGICDASRVAQGFANSFSNNFYNSASNDKLNKHFLSAYEQYAGNRPIDCTFFTLTDIKLAISNLKMD